MARENENRPFYITIYLTPHVLFFFPSSCLLVHCGFSPYINTTHIPWFLGVCYQELSSEVWLVDKRSTRKVEREQDK